MIEKILINMFNDLPYLSVIPFFDVSCFCYYLSSKAKLNKKSKKYLLPDFTKYNEEEKFSDVYIGYNELGINLFFNVESTFVNVNYPDFRKGDSVEVFIDTRDIKNKGFITRFCHHFVFFPKKIGDIYGKEITRFRGDDMHNICDPNDLTINSKINGDSYLMDIFIPRECLHGYDPQRYSKFGFIYRINRAEKSPQHFSLLSEEYLIEQNSALWATIEMKKRKN